MRSASKTARLGRISTVITVATLTASSSWAAGVIISNPKLDLKESDVTEIYRGDKQTSGGTKLSPVLSKGSCADFVKSQLGMESDQFDAHWAKKAFREGINPPAQKASDAEVIEHVKSAPGGVGCVAADPGAGVKVVKKY